MEGFPTLMGSSDEDFKHLWDTDLDPSMQDVLRLNSANDVEWTSYMEKDMPGVVIHDKLMTDAVLGTRPIKTEHSYSLASDGDSLPDSPISHHHKLEARSDDRLGWKRGRMRQTDYVDQMNARPIPDKVGFLEDRRVKNDMEDECFPAMPLNKACERIASEQVTIKDEPSSETDSPHSSCPSSPQSSFMNTSELHFDIDMKNATTQSLLKQANLLISSAPAHTILPQNTRLHHSLNNSHHQQQIISKLNIKFDSSTSATNGQLHHLPPTPPSCSSGSEDSEDNATCSSQPPSPSIRKNGTTSTRVILSHHHHSSTRQPIHTPLISSQPKGSTGTLILTEEEKRTLMAEGYSIPTRLPLTKTEEKSLKKIRRKIKNKISAQESRRKKKEYMDQLERKVEILVSENNDFRSKIDSLEDSNSNLLSQLQKLQAIVARTHPQLMKNLK